MRHLQKLVGPDSDFGVVAAIPGDFGSEEVLELVEETSALDVRVGYLVKPEGLRSVQDILPDIQVKTVGTPFLIYDAREDKIDTINPRAIKAAGFTLALFSNMNALLASGLATRGVHAIHAPVPFTANGYPYSQRQAYRSVENSINMFIGNHLVPRLLAPGTSSDSQVNFSSLVNYALKNNKSGRSETATLFLQNPGEEGIYKLANSPVTSHRIRVLVGGAGMEGAGCVGVDDLTKVVAAVGESLLAA